MIMCFYENLPSQYFVNRSQRDRLFITINFNYFSLEFYPHLDIFEIPIHSFQSFLIAMIRVDTIKK